MHLSLLLLIGLLQLIEQLISSARVWLFAISFIFTTLRRLRVSGISYATYAKYLNFFVTTIYINNNCSQGC